ncbi:MAG: putative pyrophosphatase [Candidatus Paceibacter sp.]|jgi:NTP pyrophosphatase (non-canonical NTP hydrolase)|nr:putative pyrophosphatase [Candidatus Paceibacter sp.]
MERYQQELDQWFKDNNWPYWKPHEMLARLMEETGEFARLVNHLHGPKKKKASEVEQDLEEEMGDILYTLICYANANGINLDNAIRKSFDKVVSRDKNRYT